MERVASSSLLSVDLSSYTAQSKTSFIVYRQTGNDAFGKKLFWYEEVHVQYLEIISVPEHFNIRTSTISVPRPLWYQTKCDIK